MFVLKECDGNFTWPVEIRVPADGGHRKHEIKVTFKMIDQDRIDGLLASADVDLLREVVVGWSGVQDEDGNEIAFSDDVLGRIIKKAFVRTAMAREYIRGINGLDRKN
ncbi:MAG TPA: hypothetical protein ENI55_06350 [Alphaproteobacteria bacterium]|nr:hypothetical protein [Alphaproteobacteria bacterium]